MVAGIAYIIWRYNYFGYLLPNPAYIKTKSIVTLGYIFSFFSNILTPYIILGVVSLYFVKKPSRLIETTPPLFGFFIFAIYLTIIVPIQGFLWRFAYPIMGPALFLVIVWARNIPIKRSTYYTVTQLLISLFFVAWSFQHLPLVDMETQSRTQVDRVLVAKSLYGLSGSMYVIESGASAYYSEWIVVDHIGLNSEEIAHGTLSRKVVLERLEPDIVMLIIREQYEPDELKYLFEYLNAKNNFAVVATHKSGIKYHLYFVRRNSTLCDEITQRLRTVEGVKYGDLESIMVNSPTLYSATNLDNCVFNIIFE